MPLSIKSDVPSHKLEIIIKEWSVTKVKHNESNDKMITNGQVINRVETKLVLFVLLNYVQNYLFKKADKL